MSLEHVLDILAERGLRINVGPDEKPSIVGPRDEVTDALREALAEYRQEIILRFKPKMVRRVALLRGGRDSEVERVLEECVSQGHHGRVRHWSQQSPGRMVAAEWLHKGHDGERWIRFLWIKWPKEASDEVVESAEIVA